jgi:hypothetical protein
LKFYILNHKQEIECHNNILYICFRGFDENSSEGSSSPSHSECSDVDDPLLDTRIAELQRDNQLLQVSIYLFKILLKLLEIYYSKNSVQIVRNVNMWYISVVIASP